MRTRTLLIQLRGNYSQEYIAKRLGLSPSYLQELEEGLKDPSIKLMKHFERLYERKMLDLFPDMFWIILLKVLFTVRFQKWWAYL